MLSLGLADSRAISKLNGGTERHVREILRRLSSKYKLYYLPTTHSFSDISEEQLKEVKKYAKVPSFFEYLLDKKQINFSLFRELFTFSPLAKELLSEYKKEIDSLDFIYIPHNYRLQLMSSILLSSLSRGKYGMLLITDPHNSLLERESFFACVDVWNKIWFSRKAAIEFCSVQRLQNITFLLKTLKRKPRFIGVMNRGALKYTKLPAHFNVKVLSPPHAFNSLALKYRNFDKEDYLVFLGRINTAKGANEALEVGKHVKLKMIGYQEQKFIVKQAKSSGIEVIENVSEEEKFEILSKAKALISPSHQESFSVTILESLAVGTPVITYDLPSLTSIYNFKSVFFVKEFDIKSLVNTAIEVYKMKRIEELFNDEKLEEFIKLHSSWDNVSNAVDRLITEAIQE
ncbi:glycosyltransferase [Sulfuracidifex metallicus]|uniref:Glycosyltransferase n=1 Tax=Sulfuracidifex metallicus DSM 6482 = JCM 9184 TaxID=523847 RepID=A0A6A9QJT8_SULME|nr:glycosyltransferase [Sulfuracidifex metallicus]MUN28520.1 glycosyltransferase [Sulfuracidifex metallicus DSM 6482 = JCM 9184]WOE50943.1 glycosyltransferase [Sulfuracidifex metallicus DSM 6482 = JCM 9184]